jgi:hypothetical protein
MGALSPELSTGLNAILGWAKVRVLMAQKRMKQKLLWRAVSRRFFFMFNGYLGVCKCLIGVTLVK